jgi:hypothetical protein
MNVQIVNIHGQSITKCKMLRGGYEAKRRTKYGNDISFAANLVQK